MIRVLIVDDHPAVRAGLVAVMRAEPGLLPVASAADPDRALTEARQRHPHVALVDYHLREGDGLLLCMDLKAFPAPPRGLIYSAGAEAGLRRPATMACADGLVEWASPRLEVRSHRPRLHAAVDGEAVVLQPPLELEIRPRALRVLVPPA